MLSAGVYVGDIAPLAFVQWAVAFVGEQIGKPQNSIERRSQLVAHRGEKLILELAGTLNLLFRMEDGIRKLLNLLLGSFKLCRAFLDALLQLVATFL